MDRKTQIEQIRQADAQLSQDRAQCRQAGRGPLRFIRRHQASIILGGGFTLGFVSGRPRSILLAKAAVSSVLAAIRLQPQLRQLIQGD